MAVRDVTKKPFIVDRDNDRFVGIEYPFRRSDGNEGWFASTSTTIEAVKTNIKMLLSTNKGERIFQPHLGLNLRKFLFEPITNDTQIAVENEIVDAFQMWLPFVELQDIQITLGGNDPLGKNTIGIFVIFNIIRDPTTLESVQVEIGE